MNTVINCEHEFLEKISEPYLKGFSDFVLAECLNCRTELEIENFEDDECAEPAPEWISFYNARFTGTPVAACTNCRFITSFFECGHDLQHDCNEYQ
jgi:hypothetical protein